MPHTFKPFSSQTARIPWRPTRTDAIVAGLLSVMAFALYYGLELHLDSLGTFDRNDVLFDADPNKRIGGISHGWGGLGNRGIWHPILSYLYSLPIRAVSYAVTMIGIGGDSATVERALGMLVVPSFAGAAVGLFFCVARLAQITVGGAIGVAVLAGGAFSQLLFGSIPDHFAIAGFALALAYLAALATMYGLTLRLTTPLWIVAGVLAVGITATNGLPYALMFVTAHWLETGSLREACRRSLRVGALVLSFVVTLMIGGAVAYGEMSSLWKPEETSDFVERYWNADPWARFTSQAVPVLGNTMAPPRPSIELAKDYGKEDAVRRLSFEDSRAWLRGVLVTIFAVAGGFIWWSQSAALRTLSIVSLAIVIYNLTLHAFFGREYFVYSQHWLPSLVFLVGGVFASTGPRAVILKIAAWSAIAAMIINNTWVFREVIAAMQPLGFS